MDTSEGGIFSRRQRRGKLLALVVLLAAGGAAVALIFLLSPGNSFEVYSFGDPCASDCGQHPGNALRCVGSEQSQFYCSRPCGEAFPSCPDGFECKPLQASETVVRPSTTHESYCLRIGGAAAAAPDRAGPGSSSPPQVAFKPLTVRLPAKPDDVAAEQRATP